MKKFIPVNEPLFNGLEKKYLIEAIDSGWISSEGPFVKEFEIKFSNYVNRKEGIAVSNGSGALDIAVKALGIDKGDEVIMPAFTIISPALSLVRAGAIPVLIDCDLTTWNMDTNQIEAKITSKTKAIIVVHIYGLPVDMDPILDLCKKHNLFLIEDAAEMHGQTYKGEKCGSFGDISIFSFYSNKHITTGEGGMIVTNNERLAEKCRYLRNLCFDTERRYIHEDLGWNYRMTNLQAAIGLGQLENIDNHLIIKRKIGEIYNTYLLGLKYIKTPLHETNYAKNIYWVYGILIDEKIEMTVPVLIKKMQISGIGTRHFFYPMHLQPVFIRIGLFKNEKYPNAEYLASRGLYLPSGLGLNINDIESICSNLKSILML